MTSNNHHKKISDSLIFLHRALLSRLWHASLTIFNTAVVVNVLKENVCKKNSTVLLQNHFVTCYFFF